MSSALREPMLKEKLEKLECHFTWNLPDQYSQHNLKRKRNWLEDICTNEDNRWLGPIYNLLGFINFRVNSTVDVRSSFSKAAEAFGRLRRSDKGPWLMVNYANLAWYHYHQKEETQSQYYLSEVEALMKEYSPGTEAELHPEICAEKGWFLMTMNVRPLNTASDHLRRAVEMQPEMVEWQTTYVLCQDNQGDVEDIVVKLKEAKDRDPENLYLAALYHGKRGASGENIEDEINSLAEKVLMKPVHGDSGLRRILKWYRFIGLVDRAIMVAEKALEKHPDRRYLKRCAALCYEWKIVYNKGSPATKAVIERAISLHEQVLEEYPGTSLLRKMYLAFIYARGDQPEKGEGIFQELLAEDLDPPEKQMLYNVYAKYLYFMKNDSYASIDYHMKVVEIQIKSWFKIMSIRELQKTSNKVKDPKRREILECLRENTDEEERRR